MHRHLIHIQLSPVSWGDPFCHPLWTQELQIWGNPVEIGAPACTHSHTHTHTMPIIFIFHKKRWKYSCFLLKQGTLLLYWRTGHAVSLHARERLRNQERKDYMKPNSNILLLLCAGKEPRLVPTDESHVPGQQRGWQWAKRNQEPAGEAGVHNEPGQAALWSTRGAERTGELSVFKVLVGHPLSKPPKVLQNPKLFLTSQETLPWSWALTWVCLCRACHIPRQAGNKQYSNKLSKNPNPSK